ncbi:MAG: hypothetical protein OJK14_11375 [Achromobacter sp.]|uniref:hypothetical protein n=1 Tax=Achromobacter sp. TaxID=134375 RepID=UPI002588E773|nr:hypothetical protein [Achromobacter sp.]MCW0207690.1 hypothetical protein [Achromobacter sp.]
MTGKALKAPRPLKAESAKTGEQVEQFLDRIADAPVPTVAAAHGKRIKSLEDRMIVPAGNIARCGRPMRGCDETLGTDRAACAQR